MRVDYKALSNDVLVVVKEGAVGDWACYIGSVAGNSHDEEYLQVLNYGAKITEQLVNILFPSFKHLRYRS